MNQIEDISKKNIKKWEIETSIYHDRLELINKWKPIEDEALIRNIPNIPLNYIPSPKGLAAVNISIYVLSNASFALKGSKAFLNVWYAGLFETISLPVRLIYEIWGASHYAHSLFKKISESDDLNNNFQEINNLIIGARTKVRLPWGGNTDTKSIHVMDFIRCLKDVNPDAEKKYDFLCESCHPNFLMLTYWSLTSPLINNFSNNEFNKNSHELLDKTLLAMEIALNGLALDLKETLELAIPYIIVEAPKDAF